MRFFFALRPFPAYGLAAAAAVTLYGTVAVAWSPGELDSALGLLLFVQLFIASTGFATTAHRGHFDPMLGYGQSRTSALAAQWLSSIAPGLLAWIVIVSSAFLAGSPSAWSAAVGTRAAAFVIVSSVAWSAGFGLPRGAAGVLWTAVLMALLLGRVDVLAWAGTETTFLGSVRTAAVILICPFVLLGSHVQAGAASVTTALSCVVALLFATWRTGARLDIYLVERV